MCLALLPFFMAADDTKSTRREENLKRVGDMTPSERQRLEENYRTFQQLPPDEQARLRKLQAELESDPELKAAIAQYEGLVNTLSPGQCAELRRTSDPRDRARLIEDFRHFGEPPPPRRPPNGNRPEPDRSGQKPLPLLQRVFAQSIEKMFENSFERIPSTRRETEAMLAVLDKELPQARRDEFQRLDPLTRQIRVLRESVRKPRPLAGQLRPLGDPKPLIDVLDEGGPVKQFVTQNRQGPVMPRLMQVLLRGLMLELRFAIEEKLPSTEALQNFEQSLATAEQERLSKMPERDRQEFLQLKYLEQQVPAINELREMLAEPPFSNFNELPRLPGGPMNPGQKGTFGGNPLNDGPRPDRPRENPFSPKGRTPDRNE